MREMGLNNTYIYIIIIIHMTSVLQSSVSTPIGLGSDAAKGMV